MGLPTVADEVVVTQGSVEERRFVAAYGRDGRMVAAVAVDAPRWLVSPRLVTDPPPYRHNASLRGPEHLLVRFDRLLEGSRTPGRSLGGQSSLAMLRESSP